MVGAEVAGDAGGAGGEADGAQLSGQLRGEDAGFAKAVLQAAMLVVDGAQVGDFVFEVAVQVQSERRRPGQVGATPPGIM